MVGDSTDGHITYVTNFAMSFVRQGGPPAGVLHCYLSSTGMALLHLVIGYFVQKIRLSVGQLRVS